MNYISKMMLNLVQSIVSQSIFYINIKRSSDKNYMSEISKVK